jgi:hypothetical protein
MILETVALENLSSNPSNIVPSLLTRMIDDFLINVFVDPIVYKINGLQVTARLCAAYKRTRFYERVAKWL